MKKIKIYILMVGALVGSACTHTEENMYKGPESPEKDMYTTWYRGCYAPMRSNSSLMLQVNEYLVKGDTLAAKQKLASSGMVLEGMEHPLDSVGTMWTLYNSHGTEPVCYFACTGPVELTYSIPYDSTTVYNKDEWHYGCDTWYSIELTRIGTGTYLANGAGYVNSDGSAELYFKMDDVRIGARGDGKLRLRAYAHKYDTTVTYHYTYYDYIVVCNETKEVVQR